MLDSLTRSGPPWKAPIQACEASNAQRQLNVRGSDKPKKLLNDQCTPPSVLLMMELARPIAQPTVGLTKLTPWMN